MLKTINKIILNLKQLNVDWKTIAYGILLGILSFLVFIIVLRDLTN